MEQLVKIRFLTDLFRDDSDLIAVELTVGIFSILSGFSMDFRQDGRQLGLIASEFRRYDDSAGETLDLLIDSFEQICVASDCINFCRRCLAV